MTPKDLAAYADDIYKATAHLLRMAPEERWTYRPAEGNWMSLGQLARHLTDATGVGLRGFITSDWGPPPEDGEMMPTAEKMPLCTKDEALRALEDDRLLMHEMLDSLPAEEFSHRTVSAPWGGERPLWYYCLQMVEHQIAHRMQLFQYLKQLGLPVTTNDLYGG